MAKPKGDGDDEDAEEGAPCSRWLLDLLDRTPPYERLHSTSRPENHITLSCELRDKRGAVSCHDLHGRLVEEPHRSLGNVNSEILLVGPPRGEKYPLQ